MAGYCLPEEAIAKTICSCRRDSELRVVLEMLAGTMVSVCHDEIVAGLKERTANMKCSETTLRLARRVIRQVRRQKRDAEAIETVAGENGSTEVVFYTYANDWKQLLAGQSLEVGLLDVCTLKDVREQHGVHWRDEVVKVALREFPDSPRS